MSRFNQQQPGPKKETPEEIARRLARKGDLPTSFEAARKIAPRVRELQQRVLDVLRAAPQGLTDWEIEAALGDHGSTYRTRRAELVALGLVRDAGYTRFIEGANRRVWEIV